MKIIYFLIIVLMIACKENINTKNTASYNNENLYFSKSKITVNKQVEHQTCSYFILNKDEFLNIHLTLQKPLIEHLKELAPELSDKELLEVGNFQFSFLVNDTLLYVENLSRGAGLESTKTKLLNHTIPLISPKPLDFWGWFMWLKFMKIGGGQDALTDDTQTLKIEVRPYMNQGKLITGPIISRGSINIEVAEIPIDESLISVQKIQPNSGWPISKDDFDTLKIENLNRKIVEGRFNDINGIIVVKEGQLLLEQYFNGEGRNSRHDPKSVGKSIASTILGIAIADNFIPDEYATLGDYYELKKYDNYSEKKDSVNLKSLLTMSSGFEGNDGDYDSPGNEEKMYPTKNWVKFALDLPMDESKKIGSDFTYFTAGVVVLGDIIHQSVPEGLISYSDEKLFGPLEITDYNWEYTPQNIGNTAGGIRLRALDFAKYGQLYKNKGIWNGLKLVEEKWVEKSLDKHIKQTDDDGFYGYLFWNKVYHYKEQKIEVSYCSGNGGNKIFIFKDIPYVIVITASAYNDPSAHSNVDKMMVDYLLPAILK